MGGDDPAPRMSNDPLQSGKRLAAISIAASIVLALSNIAAGLLSRSTSVLAAGLEFTGDIFASVIVFLGMWMAARPPDEDHPYGHGRFEILAGLLVGILLVLAGAGICFYSFNRLIGGSPPPAVGGIWVLFASIAVKGVLATSKFRVGNRIGSAALIADAWNDTVDILSAAVALGAVSLTLHDPAMFPHADVAGGGVVGVIVVLTGLRVVRDATMELTDTMPDAALLQRIRTAAFAVPGVEGVEKCFARKTGLRYHVDIHIEVDPGMTVAQSHGIAHEVSEHVGRTVDCVAGVLVHIEPTPARATPAR